MKKSSLSKKRKNFGFYLALDLYDCDPKTVDNFEICYNYLDRLPGIMRTHKQSPPFLVRTDGVKFADKAGLSGWVPIVESGVSMHTLSVTNFISIDVYSCKYFDPKLIKKFTIAIFKPRVVEEKYFLRGENYFS